MGIQVYSYDWDCYSRRGGNSKRVKIHWTLKTNILLQNHQAKIIQKNWYIYLDEGKSKDQIIFKGEVITKM
jgi:hypothetical protein